MLGPSNSLRTKSRTILAAVMVATSFFTPAIASAQPQWGKVGAQLLRGTMELMTVATTAKAAERVGEQMQAYWKKTVLPGESAYSVRVSLSRTSWADWFSKPDLYLLIDCEGAVPIVVPVVFSDYDGSEVVFNFRCPTFPPGAHGTVRLLDDDSASNALLKGVLSTQVGGKVALVVPGRPVELGVNGSLQILDPATSKTTVLDAPDLVATVSFQVPQTSKSGTWELRGAVRNGTVEMGQVEMCLNHTNTLPTIWAFLFDARLLLFATVALGLVWMLSRHFRSHGLNNAEAEPTGSSPGV